jgi:hypothetical protein
MTETTPHVHKCGCGVTWQCSRADCYAGDECQQCEDEALTIWLDARQPVLEPVEALLSARKDDDAR